MPRASHSRCGDILHDVGGRLVACDAKVNQTLRRVFAAAEQGDAALGTKGIAVPLIGKDGERYIAHALPLTSGARRRAGVIYTAVAALFVRKAALAMSSRAEVHWQIFKLTPTELRVLLAIVEWRRSRSGHGARRCRSPRSGPMSALVRRPVPRGRRSGQARAGYATPMTLRRGGW